MQLLSLEVSNFKSLYNFRATDFGDINFVHGYNNSGKSNFLKFLHVLFKRKTIESNIQFEERGVIKSKRRVDKISTFWDGYLYDMPFIFSKNDRSTPIKYKVVLDLKHEEVPHRETLLHNNYLRLNRNSVQITIEGEITSINQSQSLFKLLSVSLADKKILQSSTNETPSQYFSEPENSALNGNEEVVLDILDLFNDCVHLIESNRFFANESSSAEVVATLATSNFKNWLYNLNLDSDRYDTFSELMQFLDSFSITSKVGKALNSNLNSFPFGDTSIGFSKFGDELEVMLENEVGRFPLKNFGTGIQQIFFLLASIFDTKSKIVLIEELELNLSPEYQELIVNNLQGLVRTDNQLDQIFFTSHSDYLCRGDFRVYEVSIDDEGKTSMTKSSYGGLQKLRRAYLDFVIKSHPEEK